MLIDDSSILLDFINGRQIIKIYLKPYFTF